MMSRIRSGRECATLRAACTPRRKKSRSTSWRSTGSSATGARWTRRTKRIDLSALYKRYSWGNGPTPLSNKAQRALKLADRTSDERWSRAFQDGRHLGVYRSNIGYYWVLRYDGSLSTHALVHAGTAADVTAKFGR